MQTWRFPVQLTEAHVAAIKSVLKGETVEDRMRREEADLTDESARRYFLNDYIKPAHDPDGPGR